MNHSDQNFVFEAKNRSLASLRQRYSLFSGAALLAVLLGARLLAANSSPSDGLLWLSTSALPLAYLLLAFWQDLPHNKRSGEGELLPTLGAGNIASLSRGVLLAGVAGFLLLPQPDGAVAWVPGLLYALAITADFLDGYLARVTDHSTELGERLDMRLDGLGMLLASALAIRYGQLPIWYILVGMARYLFLVGIWVRRRWGLPVHELPQRVSRRGLAGVQMAFIAILLLPLFSPPAAHTAALAFGVPFFLGFTRDWLHTIGALQKPLLSRSRFLESVEHWFPLALRLLMLGVFASRVPAAISGGSGTSLFLLEGFALLLAVLGISGRVAAIAALVLLGLQQASDPLGLAQSLLLLFYTGVLFLGTGPLSLWRPEERLIVRRAGEAAVSS